MKVINLCYSFIKNNIHIVFFEIAKTTYGILIDFSCLKIIEELLEINRGHAIQSNFYN